MKKKSRNDCVFCFCVWKTESELWKEIKAEGAAAINARKGFCNLILVVSF